MHDDGVEWPVALVASSIRCSPMSHMQENKTRLYDNTTN